MSKLGNSPIALEYNEIDYIEKYRSLDSSSKEHVQMILNWEFDKSNAQKELLKRLLAYEKR